MIKNILTYNNDNIEYLRSLYRGDFNEEKIQILLKFRNNLTPTGFEEYIKRFYEKKGYVTKRTGGFNDKSIDIEGYKYKGTNDEIYLIIQCKKYLYKDVNQKDVSSFSGMINNTINSKLNTNVIYITTGVFSKNAQIFCIENNIEMIDWEDIINMNNIYKYEEYEEDMINENIRNEKYFQSKQLQLFIIENNINNSQLLKLLKQIKKDYYYSKNETNKKFITNQTISYLSTKDNNYFLSIENLINDEIITIKDREQIIRYSDKIEKLFKEITIVNNDNKLVINYKFEFTQLTLEGLKGFHNKKRIETTVLKNRNDNSKNIILNNNRLLLKEELKNYRTNRYKKENIAPFMVFTNQTIDDIAFKIPHSNNELTFVYGLGENKIIKYGEDILNITSKY